MITRVRWLRFQLPLCLLAAIALACAAGPARGAYRVEGPRAEPPRLNYEANSPSNNRVIIWARIVDETGAPAPDMVAVRLYTSLGAITPTVYTRNGEVSATLENVQGPGRAKIDIQLDTGGFNTLFVEYLGPGGVTARSVTPPRVHYRFTARQCYYSTDKTLLDLRDAAKFDAGAFTVTASAIQFDLRLKILTAQFGVKITRGTQVVEAQRLRLDLRLQKGAAEIVEPEVGKRLLDLATMTLTDSDRARTTDCTPLDPLPTRTWIVCPEANVYPNEQQIQFRTPKFYVHNIDLPIMWMPYHVLNYSQSQANTFFNFQATVTSEPALSIDFPIYYAASADHIGSLHLRSLTKTTSPTGVPGLQLGIDEEYRLGKSADGAIYLDDLSRATRSVNWIHSQEIGKVHLNANASYERYKPDDEYTTRGNVSISNYLGQVSSNLNGNFSSYKDQRARTATWYLAPPMLRLGKKSGFGLGFNPFFGWQSTTALDAGTGSGITSDGFSQGLNCSLAVPTVRLLGGALMTGVNNGLVHYSDGSLINNFDTTLRFQRRLFTHFTGSLGYTYNRQQTHSVAAPTSTSSQRLDLNISGNGKNWDFYTYAAYALENDSLFGAMNINYYLPWGLSRSGQRRWFVQYASSLSVMNGATTGQMLEHIFTIGRPVGTYTALLHYSPTGSTGITGIGMVTGKKWALELVHGGW